MLFSYKPLYNHKIEKLHNYNKYFFIGLFTFEPTFFDSKLLIHPDFLIIVNAHKIRIQENLKIIHKSYIELSPKEKQIVKDAFKNNQLIEDICMCSTHPISYSELPEKISKSIKKYFSNLWDLLTNYKDDEYITIKKKCGNIYDHYCDLFKEKKQIFTVCPACGIEELLGEHHACRNGAEPNTNIAREAYDHYIPQAQYPFLSINFLNLMPIGHHCNSDYKKTYNTPYNGHERQKCFFPYSLKSHYIEPCIEFNSVIDNLAESTDWSIKFNTSENIVDEVDSWNRIFNIKERYIAQIKTKEESWKDRLFTEYEIDSLSATFDLLTFKSKMYRDIRINNQSSGIVQKAYYDYFLNNLLPSYIAMKEEMSQ